MSHPFGSFYDNSLSNGTQVAPVTSKRPRGHLFVLLKLIRKKTLRPSTQGTVSAVSPHKFCLGNGAAHRWASEKAPFPAGSPLTSLDATELLVNEISSLTLELKAQGTEERGMPYCPFSWAEGIAIANTLDTSSPGSFPFPGDT